MKTITILIGISGSGKSTWAHEKWLEDPHNTVIVNRDKIRESISGYTEGTVHKYYDRDDIAGLEKKITRVEDTLINEALESGKDVIIDSTNLRRNYIERFKYWNVKTTTKMFPITLKEAEIRDMGRTRKVGRKVINKQYSQFRQLYLELTKKPIDFTPVEILNVESREDVVVFDIDGTLAHKGDRSPYSWKEVGRDTIDSSTVAILKYLNQAGVKIIICTGRDGICLKETEDWLEDKGMSYSDIYIRRNKDMRPDWVVKEEMWRDITKKYHIVGMFDDRLQVVRRARALGFKVFNVEYNNF